VRFDPTFFYETFPRIEPEFGAQLDLPTPLRGPDVLLRAVGELELAPDSLVVDVGCREGANAFDLARLFGLRVLGLDPVQHHLDVAREARRSQPEPVAARVSFERGSAVRLPVPDASVDLVFSHDVLAHVEDVGAVLREFARALRPGGHVVAHQVLRAPSFSGEDADWLVSARGMVPASLDPEVHDRAIAAAGFGVRDAIDLGGEWCEHAELTEGTVSRAMLRVARMRRDPERWRSQYGQRAFDTMLATSMWQVHRLVGDLPGRLDVLVRPSARARSVRAGRNPVDARARGWHGGEPDVNQEVAMADTGRSGTGNSESGHSETGNDDIKARMREALDRKQAHLHPDDHASAPDKARGPEVRGGAAPHMHRRKAGGGGS
jgi:SAM-dependent methyltransferase